MNSFDKMKKAIESAEQFLRKSDKSEVGKLVWAKLSTVLYEVNKVSRKTIVIEGVEYVLDEAVFNLILDISLERDNLIKQLNGSINEN